MTKCQLFEFFIKLKTIETMYWRFKVNNIEILKEDNVSPSLWPLGKIIAMHPGNEGIVQVVTVKNLRVSLKDQL